MALVAGNPERLTLTQLLHPPTWDLPEYNGPHSVDPHRLREQLGDLDSSLALLQRYRNALRPIHRLAPDILLLVFLDLTEDDSDPSSSTFGCDPWNQFTHVCHRWRTIALACPLLWTRISTRYPEAAKTCLERSGDAPLSLVIYNPVAPEAASQVLTAALPHVARIRSIYMPSTFRQAEYQELLAPLLRASMPLLDTLHIYKVRMDGDCFALPSLFEGETPRLATLKLCYVFPEIGSVNYSGLRQLMIKGKKNKHITLELSSLLELLALCPNLEVFRAAKVTFTSNETQTSNEEGSEPVRLRLSRLKLLDIARCKASIVADLFSRLVIPESALRFDVWLERAADFSFRFGIPTTLDEVQQLRGIKQLAIEFTSANDYVIIHGTTQTSPFHITATIPEGSDMGDMATIAGPLLLSIVRTLDVTCLEEFTISETYFRRAHLGFTRRRWIEMFERMPLLKALHVRIDSITDAGFSRTILAALSTLNQLNGRLLCPHLETLTMAHDRTWSTLQCYLLAVERAKQGHPMKKVSMRLPCYENFEDIEDTDLPALRKIVDVVDIDPPVIEKPQFPEMSW